MARSGRLLLSAASRTPPHRPPTRAASAGIPAVCADGAGGQALTGERVSKVGRFAPSEAQLCCAGDQMRRPGAGVERPRPTTPCRPPRPAVRHALPPAAPVPPSAPRCHRARLAAPAPPTVAHALPPAAPGPMLPRSLHGTALTCGAVSHAEGAGARTRPLRRLAAAGARSQGAPCAGRPEPIRCRAGGSTHSVRCGRRGPVGVAGRRARLPSRPPRACRPPALP